MSLYHVIRTAFRRRASDLVTKKLKRFRITRITAWSIGPAFAEADSRVALATVIGVLSATCRDAIGSLE